ncbi:MAG: dTDP-glucose 4,6-dehydratase [Candidatus Thermoplasmatota archaeon]|jgi:dTDP-glucose 4,6-dehydratase|nr:dTDP-glucose 4,6-dehydratase [Candidatus Thermoplasmatota archaeon]MCL5963356.1 dTDP-glucose 4,6-dehydratase [Candidatus Thermoplasmatota archaeon]
MKIVVTGGLGFMGSAFIRNVLKSDNSINLINIDKMSYAANKNNVKEVEELDNYHFFAIDIRFIETLRDELDNVDWIINFAAESHVDNSILDPDPFIASNIVGTHELLKFAMKKDIKILQISTDEVYGSLKEGYANEDMILNPSSPYSASKASADMLINGYHKTYGLKTIIIRSCNNYGEYQHPEKLIPKTILNGINNVSIPIYGNGINMREWIYVNDFVEAVKFLMNKGKFGEIYNVSTNKSLTNLQVVQTILKILNKDNTQIEYVEDRKGHDFRYAMETKKLKELGWNKKWTAFDKGIANTVNWYLNNRAW